MAATLDLIALSVLTRATALGGGDFTAVLSDLDIHIANDSNAFKKLSVKEIDALLSALEGKCKARHFPFVFGDVFNFDGLPELSAFLVSSSTMRDAGQLAEWLPSLIHPAMRIDSSELNNGAAVSIDFRHPDGSTASIPVFIEMIAAVVKRFAGVIAPNMPMLKKVNFTHSARTAECDYLQYFGCPVNFNCESNQIQLNPELFDQPLPGNFPPAHAQAEKNIRVRLLDDELAAGLKEQIQTLLKKDLNLFSQGIDGIAAALHLHPRKLQRQLQAEGYRYSELLAQTRKNLACEMLKRHDLDIDSIGFKLGFEERRSFTSAFKKWQGQTPTAYRKNATTQNNNKNTDHA